MSTLQKQIKANNDNVGTFYVSIVLLLNLSPVAGKDTAIYPALYPHLEGAITAAWQANHTSSLYGSLPQVKLFLANMGSENADWSLAVDQIKANAKDNHVVSVIGLGQSTDNTQHAAAKLFDEAKLPVIGATVTGDDMNTNPVTGKLNQGFFRVSPTNLETVRTAVRHISELESAPTKVAIVKDDAPGDSYVKTLGADAHQEMPKALQFSYTSPVGLSAGVERNQILSTIFAPMSQNICASTKPSVIYFAGRGSDLGAFVQAWTQTVTDCGGTRTTIITGDDGGAALNQPEIHRAIQSGAVDILFTSLAGRDAWGPCPKTNAPTVVRAYYTFQAAFTGKPDACTGQPLKATDGTPSLAFPLSDLDSATAILTHDAAAVAIQAARQADIGAQNQPDGGTAALEPASQIGIIQGMTCAHAVAGASGWIDFRTDAYGNPTKKRVPVVRIEADGSTTTIFTGKTVDTSRPRC